MNTSRVAVKSQVFNYQYNTVYYSPWNTEFKNTKKMNFEPLRIQMTDHKVNIQSKKLCTSHMVLT